MSNWDKIVKEISYQTKSGSVDFTNPHHRYLLRKELMKLGMEQNNQKIWKNSWQKKSR